ncbi:MAG: hypothetical protein LBG73_05220 [Spirochaetaceae bacterium]|jgi:hypothetical protein|nr:hypothetical protein [Spirochaetaceae bacterium]
MGPTKESEYIDWCENLLTVCQANKTSWHLSEDKLDEISALFTQFKQQHHLCATPAHTQVDMQKKHDLKAALVKKTDVFITNELQYTYYVTDQGRAQAGVPIHDKIPTPVPAPDTIPDVETDMPYPRTLRLKFRAPGSQRWGKDPRARGVECRWTLADAPPSNIEDLSHSEFATSSPLELTFKEEQRGQRIYFALRWENGAAKKGPWSDILNAIVP